MMEESILEVPFLDEYIPESEEVIDFTQQQRVKALYRNGLVETSHGLYTTRQNNKKTTLSRIPAFEAKIDVTKKLHIFTVPHDFNERPKERSVVFQTQI